MPYTGFTSLSAKQVSLGQVKFFARQVHTLVVKRTTSLPVSTTLSLVRKGISLLLVAQDIFSLSPVKYVSSLMKSHFSNANYSH